jgi:antitoxin (DNA-binding transcriptional repressor) of toxin-antitoxin stability system
MKSNTATIRELRTDFRTVKRKIEDYGEVVITDHGEPAYLLKPVARQPAKGARPSDNYARLLKRQPKPISGEAMRRFWQEERGEC